MSKNEPGDSTKKRLKPNQPVVQQFAAGGSAVPTPAIPYDVEAVHDGSTKPAPKPDAGKQTTRPEPED